MAEDGETLPRLCGARGHCGRHRRAGRFAAALALIALPRTVAIAEDAPRVAELVPADNASDVAPGLTELRVTFDQEMNTGGFSFTGGGPHFPKVNGKAHWIDKRTCVLPVSLQPGKRYELGINATSFKNFKSDSGAPVDPVRWTFRTRGDEKPPADKAEQAKLNQPAAAELGDVLKRHYAYYDRKRIDWPARFTEFDERLTAASDTAEWARAAAELLKPCEDLHLWLEFEGESFATGTRAVSPNFGWGGVEKHVPGYQKLGQSTARGRTDDGIGYILITNWSRERTGELNAVQRAIQSMQDCKAIIVDVRPNSGGDEGLARQVAAWFVNAPKVYAKNRDRDPSAPGGWSEVLDRVIEPNDPDRRYTGRVAVLIGPANMSSCESFILMMQQARDCRLVGAKTWGSSGNPKPHKLGNGVTVFVPSWQDLLPDGTLLEGRGIEPDVRVPASPDDFERDDPVLKRALELLRAP